MAIWYLNADTGNDSTGNGSSGSPYLTLAKALTVYGVGDTIYFQNSTATYALATATINKNCTITGESIAGCVLDAAYSFAGWKCVDATITIQNLTFSRVTTSGSSSEGYGLFNMYGMTTTTRLNLYDLHLKNIRLKGQNLAGITSTFAIPTGVTATFDIQRIKGNVTYLGNTSPLFSLRTGNVATLNWTVDDTTIIIDPGAYTGVFYYLDNLAAGTVNQTITNSAFANLTGGTTNWRTIFGSSTFTVDSSVLIYGISNIHSSITNQGILTSDPEFIDADNFNYNPDVGSVLFDAGN